MAPPLPNGNRQGEPTTANFLRQREIATPAIGHFRGQLGMPYNGYAYGPENSLGAVADAQIQRQAVFHSELNQNNMNEFAPNEYHRQHQMIQQQQMQQQQM